MIPVDRTAAVPEALTRTKKYRHLQTADELTETQAILATLAEASASGEKFDFDFKRYKETSVRRALEDLFHGKCAYCEQRYAGIQPMDVEHFRPKKKAQFGDDRVGAGYYWLAADWDNLLPSCIDCNRGRKQLDLVSGKLVTMGKANQFPLEAGADPVTHHDGDVAGEAKLLLNPCDEGFDPANHFVYLRDDGVIAPVAVDAGDGTQVPDPKAVASIRVYALNRPELVADRLSYVRIFDHRLRVLERLALFLAETRNENDELDESRVLAETMHHDQIEALLDMALPNRPFAGMIRYLLRTEVPQLERPTPD